MHVFIDTYSVKIEVEQDMFVISDMDVKKKLSPYKIKSINILKHCTITTYAIVYAAQNGIPILFYGHQGKVEA